MGLYRSPEGKLYDLPDEQAGYAREQGFVPLDTASAREAVTEEAQAARGTERGVLGAVNTAATEFLSGATLGLSDVAWRGIMSEGELERMRAERAANAGLGLGANVAGTVLPALLTGGESLGAEAAAGERLLAASPAALTSRLGARVAGLGAEAGVIGRIGATAAAGAVEGALQQGGAYISDVALGDRDLTADGFMGAMGQGALWGGVAGGALGVGENALVAARRLFPAHEVTASAVATAERHAAEEIGRAVDDSTALVQQARTRIQQMKQEVMASDVAARKELNEIAVKKARDLAEQQVSAATSRAEATAARAERAATPGFKQPVRKSFGATAARSPAEAVSEQLGVKAAPRLTPEEIADAVDQAQNAALVRHSPEAADLVQQMDDAVQARNRMQAWLDQYGPGGNVGRFERSQAARDYAEGMRPKEAGYYTRTPTGEGTPGLPRGREQVWRGSEAERQLADARTLSKMSPEEMAAADAAVERMFGRPKGGPPVATAEEIVGKPAVAQSVDEQVRGAIGAKPADAAEDVGDAARTIGDFERTHAKLAESLGDAAPPSSKARSQAYREAEAVYQAKTTQAATDAAMDAKKAADTIAIGGRVPGKEASAGIVGKLADAGAYVEVLRQLGVPLPDPGNIPLVGPILSMYLKARAVMKVFGRKGGRPMATAETAIAEKAASVRTRAVAAVDKMIEVAPKVVRASRAVAVPLATTMGHILFESDTEKPKAQPKKGDLQGQYEARADELSRAMQPGAIRDAVRKRVRASDPSIVDAIVAAQERKLGFLYDKLPKPTDPPSILVGGVKHPFVPSKAELSGWARYVEAVENPAGVLEHVASGGLVSAEAAEALEKVFPSLYNEAKQRLIEQASTIEHKVPYARRVQMSMLFGIPLDGSFMGPTAQFLQAGYQAPQQPQSGSMAPTLRSDVNLGARTTLPGLEGT